MHVRFSSAVGLPVIDEEMMEQLGQVAQVLLHPDTGKVEGFFVRTPGLFQGEELFLASEDIRHWGLRVVVRGSGVLAPVEERIRLASLLEEGRPFLGQRIVTETGRVLGRCADVQFETTHFFVEWFWPRKFWRWRDPLPLSQIVDVRKDAIVVRDPAVPAQERSTSPMLERLPEAA